jgi:hypothetical protein
VIDGCFETVFTRGPLAGERALATIERTRADQFGDSEYLRPGASLMDVGFAWLVDEAIGLLIQVPFLDILRRRSM